MPVGASGATTRGGTPVVLDGRSGGAAGVPGAVARTAGAGLDDGLTGSETGPGAVPGLVAVAAAVGAVPGLRPFGGGAGAIVWASTLVAISVARTAAAVALLRNN
jgi:hypothetical protein